MTSVPELIHQTAERIRGGTEVDAGLDRVVDQLGDVTSTREQLKRSRQALAERRRALKAARDELQQLSEVLAHIETNLPYSEEGWPERRAALQRLLTDDPKAGLAEWLVDWYACAATMRLDALSRLVSSGLPLSAGSTLLDRATMAGHGLAKRDWELVAPMLGAGSAGMEIDGHAVPGPGLQTAVRLAAARLALDLDRLEEGREALNALDATEPTASSEALRARLARLDGHGAVVKEHLEHARELDPRNLDLAVELITQANEDQSRDLATDAARAVVDAMPSLHEVEDDLACIVAQPPAELWLAVAERAEREGHVEKMQWALDRAASVADRENNTLLAAIYERRADLPGRDNAEVAQFLVEAGSYRVSEGQLQRAREHFERALRLTPDHVDAALRLADCLVVLANELAVGDQAAIDGHALELVRRVDERRLITTWNSWGYLVEADARLALSRQLAPGRSEHLWRALLASARSVIRQPSIPRRWCGLSNVARCLRLYHLADAASGHAATLEPTDRIVVQERILACVNLGRLDESLELLRSCNEPWSDAMQAYVLVRKGEPADAVRVLNGMVLEPSRNWDRTVLVEALLLSDDQRTADAEARQLAATSSDPDDYDALYPRALAALVAGRAHDAEVLGRQLAEVDQAGIDEGEGLSTVAMARMVGGDSDGASAAFLESARICQTLRGIRELEAVVRPMLVHFAARAGTTPPPLDVLDASLAERREAITASTAPASEIMAAPAGSADSDVVALTKALSTALLHYAAGDLVLARTAADLADALRSDDTDIALLHEYLSDPDARTGIDLHENQEAAEPLAAEESPTRRLLLELPASWFTHYDDPVNNHPLFLRYLPEMRLRESWEVPPVHVRPDDNLEPGGYQISVDDETIEIGQVDVNFCYCDDAALDLLPGDLTTKAEEDESVGLHRLPADVIQAGGALAQLITMPAVEVVARRLGAVATLNLSGSAPTESL